MLYTELNANRETHKALHFLFFGLHQNYVHTLSGFFSCKYMCIVDCPWLSLIIFSCSIYLYYQFNLCYINCKYRIIWRFLLQVSYNIGNINMTDWDKLKWLKFVRVKTSFGVSEPFTVFSLGTEMDSLSPNIYK